jgi:hypothetical protein
MKPTIFSDIFSAGRKFIIAALLVCAIGVSAFAAGPDVVDTKVTDHFANSFKNVSNVDWSSTDLYTKASFNWMNEKMEAFYDNDGDYFGTSHAISVNELPAKALRTIQEKYIGSVATQAIEFDDAQNHSNYYVSLESAKSSIILQVSNTGETSVFKKINK